MKQIKSLLLSAIATVGIFTVTLVSCTPDPCKDVICNNGGNCLEGACQCANGFEGNNCETLSRAKFIGMYNVVAGCQANYSCNIIASSTSDSSKVIIQNPANLSTASAPLTATCNASISASKTITITRQFVGNLSTTEIEGSGTYSNGVISMNYTIYVGGAVAATCTGTTWTKQ